MWSADRSTFFFFVPGQIAPPRLLSVNVLHYCPLAILYIALPNIEEIYT